MAQESPLLKTSLITLVDTLVERLEPTHLEPFVEAVPPMDEMPTLAEVSKAMIEFTGVSLESLKLLGRLVLSAKLTLSA